MKPVDVNHIPAAPYCPASLRRERVFGDLSSPHAKSARLLELYQQQQINYPAFPLHYADKKAAARCYALLHGLTSYQEQRLPLCIKIAGRSAEYFRGELIGAISRRKEMQLQALLLVGSAASYVVGNGPLVSAVTRLATTGQISAELYQALDRKAQTYTFTYNDLDFQIHVTAPEGLAGLASEIRDIRWPQGVDLSLEHYEKHQSLRIKLSDGIHGLDFMVYGTAQLTCVTSRSDMRVDLIGSSLSEGSMVYCSVSPWDWCMGHLLGIAMPPTEALLSHHHVPRILGSIVKDGCVCTEELEEALAQQLAGRLCQRPNDELAGRLTKYLKDHPNHVEMRAPLVLAHAQLLQRSDMKQKRLRQIFSELLPFLDELRDDQFLCEAARLLCRGEVTTRYVLAYLQVIAGICLLEGVQEPCSVKLITTCSGKTALRMRLRRGQLHWDLQLPFALDKAVATLAETGCPQAKLRPLLHVFWKELRLRDSGSCYHQQRGKLLGGSLAGKLRAALVGTAQNLRIAPSCLFSLLATQLREPQELLELMQEAIENDYGSDALRAKHGWAIVAQLRRQQETMRAEKVVDLLIAAGLEPPEGRLSFFVSCFRQGRGQESLVKRCSPLHCRLDWSSFKQQEWKARCLALLAELDASEARIDEILALITSLKLKPAPVSERRFVELSDALEPAKLVPWLESTLDRAYQSQPYCRVLHRVLFDAQARSQLQHATLRKLLHDTQRLVLTSHEIVALVTLLDQEDEEPRELAAFLRARAESSEAAWKVLARAYSMRGQSFTQLQQGAEHCVSAQTYASWCELSERKGCTESLVAILNGPLKKSQPPGGRAALALSWLLNWKAQQVSSPVLCALIPRDVNEVKWHVICAGKPSPLLLLERLGQGGHLTLYTLMLNALKPTKVEYYTRWANLMSRRLRGCQDAASVYKVITHGESLACLRRSSEALELLLPKLQPKEQLNLARELYPCRASMPIKTLTKLLEACESELPLQRALLSSYFVPRKNGDYQRQLTRFAKRALHTHEPDAALIVQIWQLTEDLSLCKQAVSTQRLQELLDANGTDLVARILLNTLDGEEPNGGQDEENVERAGLIGRVIRELTASDTPRCVELLLSSSGRLGNLEQQWLQLLAHSPARTHAALLGRAHACGVAPMRCLPVALHVLRQQSPRLASTKLQATLLHLLKQVPADEALNLWTALIQTSSCFDNEQLWEAGLALSTRVTQVPAHLGNWLCRQAQCSQRVATLAERVGQQPGIWHKKQINTRLLPLFTKWIAQTDGKAARCIWQLLAAQLCDQLPLKDQFTQLWQHSAEQERSPYREIYIEQCLLSARAQFSQGQKAEASGTLRLAIHACLFSQAPSALCQRVLEAWDGEELRASVGADHYHYWRWKLQVLRHHEDPQALAAAATQTLKELSHKTNWPQTAWELLKVPELCPSWQPPWELIEYAACAVDKKRAEQLHCLIEIHPEIQRLNPPLIEALVGVGVSVSKLIERIDDSQQRRCLEIEAQLRQLMSNPGFSELEQLCPDLLWAADYQAKQVGSSATANWLLYERYFSEVILTMIPRMPPADQPRTVSLLNLHCKNWPNESCTQAAVLDIIICLQSSQELHCKNQLGLFAVRLASELSIEQHTEWLLERYLSIASLCFDTGACAQELGPAIAPVLGFIHKRFKHNRFNQGHKYDTLLYNLSLYLNLDTSQFVARNSLACLEAVQTLILQQLARPRLPALLACQDLIRCQALPLLTQFRLNPAPRMVNGGKQIVICDPGSRLLALAHKVAQALRPHRKQLEAKDVLMSTFFAPVLDQTHCPWSHSDELSWLRLLLTEEIMLLLLDERPDLLGPFLRFFHSHLAVTLLHHQRERLVHFSNSILDCAKDHAGIKADGLSEVCRLIMQQPGLFDSTAAKKWLSGLPVAAKKEWKAHLKLAIQHAEQLERGEGFKLDPPTREAGSPGLWKAGWWLQYAQTRIDADPEHKEANRLRKDCVDSAACIAAAVDVSCCPRVLQDFLLSGSSTVLINSRLSLSELRSNLVLICKGWRDTPAHRGQLKIMVAMIDRCVNNADYALLVLLLKEYFPQLSDNERSTARSQACLSVIRYQSTLCTAGAVQCVMDSAAEYFRLTRSEGPVDGELFKAGAAVASACLGLIMKFCSQAGHAQFLAPLMTQLREMLHEHPVLISIYWRDACRAMIEESHKQFIAGIDQAVTDTSLLFLSAFGYPHSFPSGDAQELHYLSLWLQMLSHNGRDAVAGVCTSPENYEAAVTQVKGSLACAVLAGCDPRQLWSAWTASQSDVTILEELATHYTNCKERNPEHSDYFDERLKLIEQLKALA